MTDARPAWATEELLQALCAWGDYWRLNPKDDTDANLLDAIRRAGLTAPAAPIWTVADQATYAVLHRPDGTAAARFHVIAEAHQAAAALNNSNQEDQK
jgi:hypothetical protein